MVLANQREFLFQKISIEKSLQNIFANLANNYHEKLARKFEKQNFHEVIHMKFSSFSRKFRENVK